MEGTSAQVDAMAVATRHLDSAGQDLASIRGRIQQTIATTQSGYVSEAAALFRSVMDAWDADFAKIVAGLETIQNALGSNKKQYEASMDQERASVNQIAALLNGTDA
jgi:WXG100 family type VII secretion target